MNNRIIYLTVLFLLAFFPLFQSCDFLDTDDYFFNETLQQDSIFSNKRNLEKYVWGTAAYFPDEGRIFGNNYTPGPFATDEGFTLFGTGEFHGMAFVLGEVKPNNLYGMDIWGGMYQIIRKSNTILARMDEAQDMTATDKRDLLGYVYFMRAYAYYHLLMQYGPAILLGDNVLENNEGPEYYNTHRATYDECIEYICGELEKAAQYLPVEVAINFFGRPTKGAAYGLISRLRLQAASPLYNGQSAARIYFGDWKRKTDGAQYISQTYDEKKWALAALAAKRVMDMGIYKLHTIEKQGDTPPLPANVPSAPFPDGAGGIDPFRSYSYMFNGESLGSQNKEFVWGRMSGNVLDYTRHSFPVAIMGGWNGMGVTQKVIDAYYMADGRDIGNSSLEYPYSEEGFMGGSDKTFSGYLLKNSINKMYVNREMRFYASIGFSECFWTASTTSETARKNIVVTYYKDGNGGKESNQGNVDNYPITGYVLRKYIHPDDAWAGEGAARIDKPFPIIRYAEILLSYAEALNNLTTSYTLTDTVSGNEYTFTRDVEEIRSAFNQVRFRAGLPGLTEAELASPETVQKLIERERMIEFLFENRRYYDVRRWGIYEETENEPFKGMDTDAGKESFYYRVHLNHSKARNRIVDKKLIFLPISLDEIRKVPDLDQNPGWED
ncbi:RagB/SusD family nutrient uptake outer membrane protein [Limibacterium fermenti]|uniref:RagB/SusD family nutrient uptake outer membrane protein n=1 Tax=Limibacterium fermenti TaxID=3229863 RepID=UPI000E8541E9|nr:RagB/SusD family nutrient uptake outer membrane protein [Porphyromonadaceae bacterium]